jgi:8-oxo-dGTP pyrophosphatase MutT (NUDIX family)
VAISEYLRRVREKVGTDLLVVPSVTGALFDAARRLCMVEHADRGIWVLPGGAIDPGETPADALVREVWEETGLHVEPLALRGVFSGPDFLVRYRNGDEVIYVMSVFECRATGGTLRPDGQETVDVRYFAESELSSVTTPPWAGVILPLLFAPRGPGFAPPAWRPPAAG